MENIRAFFNYVDDFKIEQFKAKEVFTTDCYSISCM